MSDDNEKEKIIDLDDPSLQEAQQYDPEADRDLYVPPPELDQDGNAIDYLLKLSLGENKFKTHKTYFKKDKQDRPMGILMIDLTIQDPGQPFDGFKLSPKYLNTYVDRRSGASDFTNIARLLGNPMPKGLGVKAQAEHVEPLIGSEPLIGGRIEWGSPFCRNCEEEKDSLRGERKWPEKYATDDNGEVLEPKVVIGHIPLKPCPDCGSDLVPKVELKRFIATKDA